MFKAELGRYCKNNVVVGSSLAWHLVICFIFSEGSALISRRSNFETVFVYKKDLPLDRLTQEPSYYYPTVRECIRGLSGNRFWSKQFMQSRILTVFSCRISSMHCFISSSTFLWLGPPCGLSAICPSCKCRQTINFAVERLMLRVSTTER